MILLDITEATRRALLTEEERRAEDSERYSGILISSLAACDSWNNDPDAFYSDYFQRRYRVTLEYVLGIVNGRAREMYEDNFRGYREMMKESSN